MPFWNVISSSSSKKKKRKEEEEPTEEKLPTGCLHHKNHEKTATGAITSDERMNSETNNHHHINNEKIKIIEIEHLPLMENDPKHLLKIVHMSDSHRFHENLKNFPEGDVFIHSGDISHKSEWKDCENDQIQTKELESNFKCAPSVISFNKWLDKLPYKVKIVILGNHDIGFNGISPNFIQQKILPNAIYLQDQAVIIKYKGKHLLKIYGTPWTTSRNMGFSMSHSLIDQKWKEIPEDVDILVTHLPPFGVMDLAGGSEPQQYCDYCKKNHKYRRHWGNVALRKRAIQLNEKGKLKAHLFGHVHEFHGLEIERHSKGKVPLIYSNGASVTNHNDTDVKSPNVIEIDMDEIPDKK
ncbi:hypothetical protein FDP41_011207 [Naegleria fowleri]|uniref:Calcineurin-like phosphoesterase domain-containing protein n=1 Tax=Naegleria fowleri TaxID=5763 RepID=A0A6A5BYB3_NAEFO|nr:uncharacterized protein FDP41_011207 [Naegleria fowleri]KAF0982277.1 hypothetical protein FDP41_011207 [Naegleria fowleri]